MLKKDAQRRVGFPKGPRVSIQVEVSDKAKDQKEIPFVIGVLGDLAGSPNREPTSDQSSRCDPAEREAISIESERFDDLLATIKPELKLPGELRNAGPTDAPRVSVDLAFAKLDDFDPERLARQVEPLRKLLEIRSSLTSLQNKLAPSDVKHLDGLVAKLAADKECDIGPISLRAPAEPNKADSPAHAQADSSVDPAAVS